jgi:hypothetical protein
MFLGICDQAKFSSCCEWLEFTSVTDRTATLCLLGGDSFERVSIPPHGF